MKHRSGILATVAGFLLCLGLEGYAADPPARVGRLNYMSGSVSFQPGGVDDWAPAMINFPLKTGDRLWTDANSQAELHVGSTAIRLAPQTAFGLLNLDDSGMQIRLSQGALNVRVRQLGDNDFMEIDTPNAAVSLLRPGLYRVNVDAQGNTNVVDRSGESEVTAMGSAFTLRPQETASVSGTDTLTYDVQPAVGPDPWDQWCAARDRREDQSVSIRYVPREMVGYEDLDAYGTWRTIPEYGPVWVPANVPPGWAPYHYGHWMWVDPWGWTWVDDTPWGFAPFHYGRWAFFEGAWVWVPGRVVARPVYAPALVAFVGGSNFRLSVSVGGGGGAGVAWFPLGPREVYVPAYHVSPAYIQNVNITHVNVTNINVTNVTVVNKTYVNQTVPGAMTAVPQTAFASAQPVARVAVAVPQQQIAAAQVTGTTAVVVPRPESLTGKSSAAAVAQPPAQAANRPVVAKNTPPPPPVPFAARQQALAAHPGQPLDTNTMASLRQGGPAPTQMAAVKPAIPNNPPPGGGGMKPARAELATSHPVATATLAPAPAAQPKPEAPSSAKPPVIPVQPAPKPAPAEARPPATNGRGSVAPPEHPAKAATGNTKTKAKTPPPVKKNEKKEEEKRPPR